MINMILAADIGNAVGFSDGRLPWHLPADMARFKELTTGHTVVMGRTTYQTLKRPNGLPNRRNIVLTRQPYSEVRNTFGEVDIISSLDYLTKVQHIRGVVKSEFADTECFILGGAQIYGEAIQKGIVDRIFFTQVNATSGADVVLPFEMYSWKLFVLRQRAIGIIWEPEELSSQIDNGINTTYWVFHRIHT